MQANRWTDRLVDRQTDRQTGWQTDRQAGGQTGGREDRQTSRQIVRLKDRQIGQAIRMAGKLISKCRQPEAGNQTGEQVGRRPVTYSQAGQQTTENEKMT
jgi:hypothetical protein